MNKALSEALDVEEMSSVSTAIRLENLGKCYHIYDTPRDRLLQMFFRGRRKYFREFWALREVSFEVNRGECFGIIGRNGAGKSTLLQLLCGTLNPTTGNIAVHGRVAALLELGAGFNPEFTGRENVYLGASLFGLSSEEIAASYDAIVEFSGIGDFIDQPVKTYSSGMYVRLAFSVATSVDPDILVIDEALSVGDGEFSRRSFDRIMSLKEAGKTVLFCSHSLYQIEAICNRALWLNQGKVEMLGFPSRVTSSYNEFLNSGRHEARPFSLAVGEEVEKKPGRVAEARIIAVEVVVDGVAGKHLQAVSGESDVFVAVSFVSNPDLPAPVVAMGFETDSGVIVTSAITNEDGFVVQRETDGQGKASVRFSRIPLLKGRYWVGVVLMCENGIHFYDSAIRIVEIEIIQKGLLQGVAALPHLWE